MWFLITGYERSSLLTVFMVILAILLVTLPFSLQATDCGDILLGSRKANLRGVIALWSSYISHTFTMSHWSSGLTVCFLPQGAAVNAQGVQPTLWNWDYLLAPSRYTALVCCSWRDGVCHHVWRPSLGHDEVHEGDNGLVGWAVVVVSRCSALPTASSISSDLVLVFWVAHLLMSWRVFFLKLLPIMFGPLSPVVYLLMVGPPSHLKTHVSPFASSHVIVSLSLSIKWPWNNGTAVFNEY